MSRSALSAFLPAFFGQPPKALFRGTVNHLFVGGHLLPDRKLGIRKHLIRNQLGSDQLADHLGLKEFVDPFTGRENKKA